MANTPLRLAFLGPAGTFTHAALLNLPVAENAKLLPLATVTLAVDAVRTGQADGSLVPLENSVEGAVPATLDELAGGDQLVIAEETYLPVIFDLLAPAGTALADIRTVATHPHAEAQVRRWLIENLPAARVALVGSTAGGAEAVSLGQFDAAIAPTVSGQLYGLSSLAHDIADNPSGVTRFVLLTKPGTPPAPTGNDRTTLVAYLRDDHAGALLEILSEFATRAVNLTRIESRPTKSRIGQYSFSIDCEGHIADERVGDAVAALRRVCADVRFLGSYPRRDGEQGEVARGRTDDDFAQARSWLEQIRRNGR
ncbi:MAG TPA: prephenate dehydratase [Jatrophihabitantaceae bacterium]|nr:prephenate dehydratase [Jatrophihabitantaceae bacterium]